MSATDFHFIANCVSGFSFLCTSLFTALAYIPHTPLWRQLRLCRTGMSLVFLVVALSCGKTILFNLPPNPHIIQTSTLISASIQALLFAYTGITFISPRSGHRWAFTNLGIIAINAAQLISAVVWFRPSFWISAVVACTIYLCQLAYYIRSFFRIYGKCVTDIDQLTDEYNEARLSWIKRFFIMVSILGFTACIAPFLPATIYDCWMLGAAMFYNHVLLSFVNHGSHTAQLLSLIYKDKGIVPPPSIEHDSLSSITESEEAMKQNADFANLEKRLQEWVRNYGFLTNEQVSESLAHSMGVNIVTFRNYFRIKGNTDFRQWRMKLRIEYACQIMMKHPEYTYETVAEMTGICDRSNFLRTFRKVKGMSPKEYIAREKQSIE